MALDIKDLASKEIAGFPVWVWAVGIVGGLYLGRGLLSGGSSSPAASGASGLGLPGITGNTSGSIASTCPTIDPTQCPSGTTSTFTTGPDGCPVQSCTPNGSSPTTPPAPGNAVCYTVQSGDYLNEIAKKENTPGGEPQLVLWNSVPNACSDTGYASLLTNPNLIYPGWILRVQ